jgi:hypothetical protein
MKPKMFRVEIELTGELGLTIMAGSEKQAQRVAQDIVDRLCLDRDLWLHPAIEDVTETFETDDYMTIDEIDDDGGSNE